MTYAVFCLVTFRDVINTDSVCRALRLLNRSSLLLGSLSAAGLVLIANFQSIDKPLHFNNGTSLDVDGAEVIHKFHWSGAFFTFVIGTVWMFVQVSLGSSLHSAFEIDRRSRWSQLQLGHKWDRPAKEYKIHIGP